MQGLSGYCFHPWCLDGQVGVWEAGKSLSGVYLRNRKIWEVDTWLGHWIGGVGVQSLSMTLI